MGATWAATLRSRNATVPQTMTEGCTEPGAVSINLGHPVVNGEALIKVVGTW